MIKVNKKEEGVIALGMTIIVMFIGSTIALSLVFVFLNRLEAARNFGMSEQALYASEAGIEDVLLRYLDSSKSYTAPYTLNVGDASAEIQVQSISGGDELVSKGDSSGRIRELKVVVESNTTGASFNYGAQVGEGGLEMDDNSEIIGSVYSNGSVDGDSGAIVTGDVIVAVNGNKIKDLEIGGNAEAYELEDCSVDGDITYVTGGGVDDCPAGGDVTEQQEEIPPVDLPISDDTINDWKEDAEDGGIISAGDYDPGDDDTIGPGVIEGDMLLGNNITITLTGTVWVKGNIDISNGGSIQLDSSYGRDSGVIITDGWIHIKNNGTFAGSGDPDSYLMLLSTVACRGDGSGDCTHHDAAIDLHNNASGVIFYAADGLTYLHNNVEVVQLTAWKIFLDNNAVLQYTTGLANLNFSSGPAGGFTIKSWEEQ
ncbi:MAG: hypothetical protein WDZ40_02835 [Candidatus Spechtbacterales bacterium]